MSLVDAVCRDAPVTDQAGLRGRARGAGIYALSVHRDIADAREAWLQLEQCAETTIYQTYRWAHLWQKHLGARSGFEPAIVIGRDENAAPAFLLPMAIVRRGPFRILQWLGDQSSVYGMGLFTNHAANALDGDGFKPVWEAVLSALPPVDLVALRNIPATWRGCPNPGESRKARPPLQSSAPSRGAPAGRHGLLAPLERGLHRSAVRARRVDPVFYRAYRDSEEPEDIAVASRHLINLFETPVLFYVAGILIYVTGQTSWPLLLLAWAFVALRCLHTFVHLTSNRVRIRFRVFLISVLVLALLWIVFGMQLALS